MKIEMGKEYQTRDGKRTARVLCVDAKGSEPVVALVEDEVGCERLQRFSADGVFLANGWLGPNDLVPVPKKYRVWVNFYQCSYQSREAADKHACSGRLACKEVEFTEGEGLPAPPAAEVGDE